MVKKIAVVIGANYGDEGKGLVTDALCHQFSSESPVLNILTNGGCQRGHTVEHGDDRVVFSHLGSGFFYADSYFSEFYMINPMIFCREYDKFMLDHQNNHLEFRTVYVDPNCVLTTPYDMLINRMVETRREGHNSCGYGIWETKVRDETFDCTFKWSIVSNYDREELISEVKKLRDNYYTKLISLYGIPMNSLEKEIFYSNVLIENYVDDCIRMRKLTVTHRIATLAYMYDYFVFENAQGLLLDMDVDPNGTPSKTGMTYVETILKTSGIYQNFRPVVEPYYVTRTYLTKHGSGYLPGECARVAISPNIQIDQTNQPNDYQGEIRYGKLGQEEIKALLNRINEDSDIYVPTLVVTHVNEYKNIELLQYADYISASHSGIEPYYKTDKKGNWVLPI